MLNLPRIFRKIKFLIKKNSLKLAMNLKPWIAVSDSTYDFKY